MLFSLFFWAVSGYGHIRRQPMLKGYAQSVGFPSPYLAGWPSGVWLVAASASIVVGIYPDIGALMIGAFVIPAALYFHRFWTVEDAMQKQTHVMLFFRNVIILGASLAMFASFVALGDDLRFTVTGPVFRF